MTSLDVGERDRAAGHDALRRDGVGQRSGSPIGDLGDLDTGGEGGPDELDVTGTGVLGDVQLFDDAGSAQLGSDGLGDGLRTLGEELAGFGPTRLAQQSVSGGDPAGTLGQHAFFDVRIVDGGRVAGRDPGPVSSGLLGAAAARCRTRRDGRVGYPVRTLART